MAGETAANLDSRPAGVALWRRQVGAMLGLELKKTFLRARALPVVLVAFLPAVLLGLRVATVHFYDQPQMPAAQMATVYGGIFQLFFLRFVVFFGCFGVFTYLVRGEIAERSLHFYLLAPLRREVFLVGKYLAGTFAATVLFLASLFLQIGFAFLAGGTAGGSAYLFDGPGLGHAAAYAGVTVLAVVGYGAVFLALALAVRNPMIPAAGILGWEWLNFLFPPALKQISVIHHLQSLCPVPIPAGPFALPAEPTPLPLALAGFAALVTVLLALALRKARRLEVLYAGD
jgi:ABC-type transport system involved in multi-copper enzyme maturation permease subunit